MLEFPLINDTSRKIIHIDMDAFFAQVEMRDDPSLKDKPVIIGHDPRKTGGRGVVSTCNYEARKYGVHSAMSSKELTGKKKLAFHVSFKQTTHLMMVTKASLQDQLNAL